MLIKCDICKQNRSTATIVTHKVVCMICLAKLRSKDFGTLRVLGNVPEEYITMDGQCELVSSLDTVKEPPTETLAEETVIVDVPAQPRKPGRPRIKRQALQGAN